MISVRLQVGLGGNRLDLKTFGRKKFSVKNVLRKNKISNLVNKKMT